MTQDTIGTVAKLIAKSLSLVFVRNYGPFVATLLSFSIAWAAGVATFLTEKNTSANIDAALRDLLNRKLTPSREHNAVVEAAALDLIQAHLAADPLFETHHAAFKASLTDALDRERLKLRSHRTLQTANPLPPTIACEAATETTASAASTPSAAGQTEPARASTAEPKSDDIRLARCPHRDSYTVEQDSNVFVPAQLACVDALGDAGGCTGATNSPVVLAHATLAHRWTEGLFAIREKSDDNFEVIQAYYVTNNGAMTNVSSTTFNACAKYYDEDTYSLAERPYMVALRKLRDREPVRATEMYVDAAGMGVLGTICLADTNSKGELLGAACVDYQPKIFARLTENTPLLTGPRAPIGLKRL